MLLCTGCVDRDTGSDAEMDAEPVEHPAELLEAHELACEDWCALQRECEREPYNCSCAERSFDDEHVLCVEKAILVLECQAALECEEFEFLGESVPAQDERCFGEAFAETIACYREY